MVAVPVTVVRQLTRIAVVTALALSGLVAVASPAAAASFSVTTAGDGPDLNVGDGICAAGGGECSLRAAVQEANASAGADVINLSVGTYTVALGQLPVTSSITVAGTFGAIIDANGTSRIFDLTSGSLSLDNVTLRDGRATDISDDAGGVVGGAVRHAAGTELVADAVIFDNNTAFGNPDPDLLHNAYGGAVGGWGTATIVDSVFSSNSAIGADAERSDPNGTVPGEGGAAIGGAVAALGGSTALSEVALNGNQAIGGDAGNFSGDPALFSDEESGGNTTGSIAGLYDTPVTLTDVSISGDTAVSGSASSVLDGPASASGGFGADAGLVDITQGSVDGLLISGGSVTGGAAGTPSAGFNGRAGGQAVLAEIGVDEVRNLRVSGATVTAGVSTDGADGGTVGGFAGDGGSAIAVRLGGNTTTTASAVEVVDSTITGTDGGDGGQGSGGFRAGGAAGTASAISLGVDLALSVSADRLGVTDVTLRPGAGGTGGDGVTEPEGNGGGVSVVGSGADITHLNVSGAMSDNGRPVLPVQIVATEATNLAASTVTGNGSAVVSGQEIGGVLFLDLGGLFAGSPRPLTVTGSALDGGAAPACVEATYDVSGGSPELVFGAPVPTSSYNASSDDSCGFAGTGDLVDVADFGFEGSVAPTGAGITTRGITTSSVLLDAGAEACVDALGDPLISDARGEDRPLDGDNDTVAACDIGAFELDPPAPPPVPTLSDVVGAPATVAEGSSYSVSGTTSLPSGSVHIDWGDGSTDSVAVADGDGDFSADHVFTDNGSRTVTLTPLAADERQGTAVTTTATVTNVAPMIDEIQIVDPNGGAFTTADTLQFIAVVTDPGSGDTFQVSAVWGDRSSTALTNGLSLTHRFKKKGTFNVTVTVRDDDGGVAVLTVPVTIVQKPTGKP